LGIIIADRARLRHHEIRRASVSFSDLWAGWVVQSTPPQRRLSDEQQAQIAKWVEEALILSGMA
jgi:hypothetical protein